MLDNVFSSDTNIYGLNEFMDDKELVFKLQSEVRRLKRQASDDRAQAGKTRDGLRERAKTATSRAKRKDADNVRLLARIGLQEKYAAQLESDSAWLKTELSRERRAYGALAAEYKQLQWQLKRLLKERDGI